MHVELSVKTRVVLKRIVERRQRLMSLKERANSNMQARASIQHHDLTISNSNPIPVSINAGNAEDELE